MYKKEPHKRFVGFQISRTQRCFKRVIEKGGGSMPISGIHSLYDYRIGAIEQIQHHDNYELKKGGHSAFYDHTEPLEETIPDFADYFIEAQQMLVRV